MKQEKNKFAYFFNEETNIINGKWILVESSTNNNRLFVFKNNEWILTDEQIEIAKISMNNAKKIMQMANILQNIMNGSWTTKNVVPPFLKKIRQRIGLNKNFFKEGGNNLILVNKIMILISKILASLVILFEALTINQKAYTLKKKTIIVELFSLLESFGILWHYVFEYNFEDINTREEDFNTVENWRKFYEILLSVQKEKQLESDFIKLVPKEIEQLKRLRKIFVHQEKVYDTGGKRNEYYSIDYKTLNIRTLDLKKISLIAEGYNEGKGKTELFRLTNENKFSNEELIDVYEVLEIVSNFFYFWFYYVFMAK